VNIFEINNTDIIKSKYHYQIDNFYKYPEKVENFIKKFKPFIHKWDTPNSLNTIDFLDCRHDISHIENFINTEKILYKLLNRDHSKANKLITTNYIKFYNLKDEYTKNFWWPHIDDHCFYNGIIYLNKSTCDGTNLYEKLLDNEGSEHTNPWQNKNKYNILCNIKSAYNRLVVFKADIYHGMAYDNDKFRNNFRKNQIIFIK